VLNVGFICVVWLLEHAGEMRRQRCKVVLRGLIFGALFRPAFILLATVPGFLAVAESGRGAPVRSASSAPLSPSPPVGIPAPVATLDQRVGSTTPLNPLPVDLVLYPSGGTPVVGETWSMLGQITNRSKQPIWIVYNECELNVPPEVWGVTTLPNGSDIMSLNAFFPTPYLPFDFTSPPMVRIDPGQSFIMNWAVDSYNRHHSESPPVGWAQVLGRIDETVRDFLFYRPAEFTFAASIQIWSDHPPVFREVKQDQQLIIANPGESSVIVATKPVLVNQSPWVLMIGAVFGGVTAFALQLIYGLSNQNAPISGVRRRLVGMCGAILLPAIGTVLLSRLGSSDFLVSVKIHDIWGSVASGFILQWLGVRYFSSQIDALIKRNVERGKDRAADPGNESVPRPQDPPAGGGTPAKGNEASPTA
jgi:hypothetical protein